VPVHIISVEEDTRRGLRMGARAFLHKPVSKQALEEAFQQIRAFAGRRRRLLVAMADEERIRQVRELLDGPDLDTVAARTGQEALAELQAGAADCLVLDPQLPDLDPFQLLERVREACPGQAPPVVLQPGPALPRQAEEALTRLAGGIPLRVAPSPERLLLETTLLLHRPQAGLGPAQRQLLEQFQRRDPELDGRTVLVVDDDIRNIFALTAALEGQGVKVLPAESGREALAALAGHPEVDLVFMDLMLPEMDGYETMRAIRAMDRHRDLPLVALTAKAMQGEREKSLAAGASDYVTKPVDPEQVFSVIRLRLEGRVAP
jgi:CheY-like chemotaxis protein